MTLACTGCRAPLPAATLASLRPSACGSCGALLSVEVFPALLRPLEPGRAADSVVVESDSGCFYHPQKKAMVPCDICGRFLCALCDVEIAAQHLCPACLDSGTKSGRLESLDNQRTLHDRLALSLAIYPMLFFYFTVLTAPATLYVTLRYWKSPGSLLPHTKVRFVIAALLASLQIAGWTVGAYFLVRWLRSRT